MTVIGPGPMQGPFAGVEPTDDLRRRLMEFINSQSRGNFQKGGLGRRSAGGTGGRGGQAYNPRPMPLLGKSPFSRQLQRGIGGLMGPSNAGLGGTPGMGGPPPGFGVPNVPNPGIRPQSAPPPSGGGVPSDPYSVPTTPGVPVDYTPNVDPYSQQPGVAYPGQSVSAEGAAQAHAMNPYGIPGIQYPSKFVYKPPVSYGGTFWAD